MMREFNCDSLKRLSVPDELMDKALAAPHTAAPQSTAPVKLFPLRRTLIAAASFILAATVGVSVYFLTRVMGDTPIPVAPVPATSSVTEPVSAPTESYTESSVTAATTAPTEQIQPTSKPTQSPAVPAIEDTEPEPKPADTEPTVRPTVSPTSRPPEPPTEAPVLIPTEPVAAPTDHPEPPEPWEDPTEQPWEEIASVGYMIPLSSYSGGGDIFCRLYSSSGVLMGSGDLYDDSHRVYYTTGSGYLMLSYPLSAVGEPLPADNYTLVFYDESGDDFYICSAFLSRK